MPQEKKPLSEQGWDITAGDSGAGGWREHLGTERKEALKEGDRTSSDPVRSSWRKPSQATEVPAAVLAPVYLLSWVGLDFGKPN